MENRRSVVALTATAALMTGGCGSVEFAQNPPELQRAFDATMAYWHGQGAQIGKLSLRTVEDGGVSCGKDTITNNSLSPLTYCGNMDGARILVSKKSYAFTREHAKPDGISAEAIGVVVIGHEVGHHLRVWAITPVKDTKEGELEADCVAGVSVKAINPALGEEAKALLASMAGGVHGTSEERTAAFDKGFESGIEGCNEELPILLGLPLADHTAIAPDR